MTEAMAEGWGNPSSLHSWGQRATLALEIARQQVGGLLGAAGDRIAFTSGGTEADNLAIFGVANTYTTPAHMVISSVEHAAIETSARRLESRGWRITRVPVSGDKSSQTDGTITAAAVEAALEPDTALVSIIHGQSEVGTIQPIAEIGDICRQAGVLFHSDAVQTAGRIPIQVDKLGVDLLSISSHKIYGPQGAGALFIREGVKLSPHMMGGRQESGWRGGTQAVGAIAGFGIAAELATTELETEAHRLQQLQRQLAARLGECEHLHLTGPKTLERRLPHHLSYCTITHTGTTVVRDLSLQGFGISAGSACSSGQLIPSRILVAMGYSNQEGMGAIRLTLGKYSTAQSVDALAQALIALVERETAIA